MINNIPNEWSVSSLGEIVLTIIGGGTPSKEKTSYYSGNIPWMTVKDMKEGVIKDTIDHITEDAVKNSSSNVIKAGTPIVATRMSLGKIVTTDFDVAINQDLKALNLSRYMCCDYFIHCYRASSDIIQSLGTGTTVKGIRLETLKALVIPVPPLPEQKVIAEKLDSLLAQVESTKARLESIPGILKQFRQSVLAAAVSGEIIPRKSEYKLVDLDSLCASGATITYGVIKLGEDIKDGVPCLRTSNVRWLNIELDDVKKIDRKLSDSYSRTILNGGEVLVNVRGTLGGVAPVPLTMKGWNVSREVAVIPLDEVRANSEFVALWIASTKSQQWLADVSKGVAYVGINLVDLRALPIELPATLEEQEEIVDQVRAFFGFADKVAAQVKTAMESVNHLTQSILAQAFSGELTKDWREQNPDLISGENSAAALLERIKAEREKLKAGKKG